MYHMYIGWPNRFLGIDSWAPQKFTNSGYGTHFIFFILFCSLFPVSYCRSVLIIPNLVIPPNYHIFPPDFPGERRVEENYSSSNGFSPPNGKINSFLGIKSITYKFRGISQQTNLITLGAKIYWSTSRNKNAFVGKLAVLEILG